MENRKDKITEILKSATGPISASSLAANFGVSRQIIVGDIALLRASGIEISSTPRGYILGSDIATLDSRFGYIGIIACNHEKEKMADELYTIVDFGGYIFDVMIEHPVYGQISGSLDLASRYDVDCFIEKSNNMDIKPLSALTSGIHLHKIGCRNEEIFNLIKDKLNEQEILLK